MGKTRRINTLLLLAIASGVWANALLSLVKGATVSAQSKSAASAYYTSTQIKEHLDLVDTRTAVINAKLEDVKGSLGNIESTLDEVKEKASDAADVKGDVGTLDLKCTELEDELKTIHKYVASITNGTCPSGSNLQCVGAH